MVPLRLLLSIALFATITSVAPSFAATQAELQNDIAYYRRMAEREKMGPNDRLYILLRLHDKYLDSGVDLAELKSEIARQDAARAKTAAPLERRPGLPSAPAVAPVRRTGSDGAAPEPAKAEAPPAAPTKEKTPPVPVKRGEAPLLEKVRVEKNDGVVSLVLGLSRNVVPRATRVDDPARPGRPLLLIDLPGTRQRLSAVSRDLRWQEGPLASAVVSETAEGVRVQIELNGEVPYRVLRADRNVVVETRPAAPPWSSPQAAHALKNAGREPAAAAKGPQGVIGAADVLDVRVEPVSELSREAAVRDDGTIDFPLAGPLFVRGMTAAWVERNLAQKLEPFVPRPRVTVRVRSGTPGASSARNEPAPDSVFLIGQVVNPGHYPYAAGITLLEAVSRAGGVAGAARPKRVKIFRQTSLRREVFDVDLARVLDGDTGKDVALQAGDIVLVPAKPLYGGGGSGWLPWLTLATLVAAVILAV